MEMTNTSRPPGLHIENISLAQLAADYGTPLYVYSKAALTEAYMAYANACKGRNARILYAMKANSNLSILRHLASLGAGFDIVSGGELARISYIGGTGRDVVFSGVGKTEVEIRAAIDFGVHCFNIESIPEMQLLNSVAMSMCRRVPVSIRVNPHVDAKTHPYISTGLKGNKFGVAYDEIVQAYASVAAMGCLHIVGIDCHIGSQILDSSPYFEALDRVLDIVEELERLNIFVEHIDVGGGLGIAYETGPAPDIDTFVTAILDRVEERGHDDKEVIFEPGRSLVGNAGTLLTQVQFVKKGESKNFCIIDAAMNDLARPAMYEAYHRIDPVFPREGEKTLLDIVGPVCESGDWMGRNRSLCVRRGDLLAIRTAGAYGFAMSSNYNTRPRAAEVLVDGSTVTVIRRRETVQQLFANEVQLEQIAER